MSGGRAFRELRTLRNRCLQATADRNVSTLVAAFNKMTPAELTALRADATTLAWSIQSFLDERADVMKVSDRDE